MSTLRRMLVLMLGVLMIAGCDRADRALTPAAERRAIAEEAFAALWDAYKLRFVRDGRVLDLDNQGVSHSEGQGYGMLLAEAAGDRETFDRLLEWTDEQLLRADGLFAWRFGTCPPETERERVVATMGRAFPVGDECVNDANNASDGEILIAWALLRGAQRWAEPAYLERAGQIADATVRRSLVGWNDRVVLLPGVEGFEHPGQDERLGYLVVNLSYWVFPALDALAAEYPEQPWAHLRGAGHALIRVARFGEHALPPDWLALDATGGGVIGPAGGFDPVFGYNAVRIPLHLVWGRQRWESDDLEPFLAWWSVPEDGRFAAWVDLETGGEAGYRASAGVQAIAQLVRALASGTPVDQVEWPGFTDDDGYYSWSLALLSRVAALDALR